MQNISIENIYWMLAYAFRCINEKSASKMSDEKFENIYDLFSVMMFIELNKQVKRGLNKEYIPVSENTSTIRGKIVINDMARNSYKNTSKLLCEYDEYSSNSYLNKIVKTACHYLIKSNKIKEKDKVIKLKNSLLYFDGVDIIDPNTIKWDFIKYNRFNSSYKILINISYLVLKGLLISKKNNQFDFKDYVDDQKMHKLYEKFILEYFRYHYKELKPSVPQVAWNVDEDNEYIYLLPKMQTDITLYKDDRTLIIDAKYYNNMYQNNTLYDKDTFKSHNLYQIFTYVKNEDKNNTGKVSGMLLYAKTDNNEKQYAEYEMGNNKIIICNLDLSKDFNYVQEQLNDIADRFSLNTL